VTAFDIRSHFIMALNTIWRPEIFHICDILLLPLSYVETEKSIFDTFIR